MTSSFHVAILAGVLCAPLLCQSGPSIPDPSVTGKFLVGTYGWSANFGKVLDAQNSVQILDPYSGVALMLDIVGRPADEAPSAFIIESPTSFLMATKKLVEPASGSVYRVVHTRAMTWTATRLHPKPLPINANAMVAIGDDIYVVGSSKFGNGLGTYDAHVYRLSLVDGSVPMLHATFGDADVGGAHGIASSVTAVGSDLHVFMFIGANTATPSEHWVISTVEGSVATKAADLPSTMRFNNTPRSWAPQASSYDPIVDAIAVPSRWGEIVWVTPEGQAVNRNALPGNYTGQQRNDIWVGMAINSDTGAITMGDYTMALDDFRAMGSPFDRDYARGILPAPGIAAISALAYFPSGALAYFDGIGCADDSKLAPCTYIECLPRSPEPDFALTLTSFGTPSAAVLVLGERMDQGKMIVNTGCVWYVRGNILLPAVIDRGFARWPIKIPSGMTAEFASQAFLFNIESLAICVSDTRRIVVK